MARSVTLRLLLIVSVSLCSVALASTPGAAQEVGYVTGTITAQATGQPVENACVEAYATQTDVAGSACTGPDGTYTIGVPVGTYRIRVHDPFRRFATRWAYAADSYDAADPISVVTNPDTIVGVALLDAGAIVGTVTDAVTGSPIYACVEVLAVGSDDFAAYACTDGSGQYRAVVVDPGNYNVHLTADFSTCPSGPITAPPEMWLTWSPCSAGRTRWSTRS
jgi:hypothetical protein